MIKEISFNIKDQDSDAIYLMMSTHRLDYEKEDTITVHVTLTQQGTVNHAVSVCLVKAKRKSLAKKLKLMTDFLEDK